MLFTRQQNSGPLPPNSQFAHPHPHAAVLHNATLADLGTQQPHYGANLGTAVSSSMHITNAAHESEGAAGYKMDHDNMMYYSVSILLIWSHLVEFSFGQKCIAGFDVVYGWQV